MFQIVNTKSTTTGHQVYVGECSIGKVRTFDNGFAVGHDFHHRFDLAVAAVVANYLVEPTRLAYLYPCLSMLKISNSRYVCSYKQHIFCASETDGGWRVETTLPFENCYLPSGNVYLAVKNYLQNLPIKNEVD